ncbi:hypothetical protein PG999_007693 [Apiospora kogelbergensis]|uniref:Uncharacterized protein n=1 Tax=Apiospora kogelbergensis TaxID=1337665 RepID=A0AAW0QU79_9PEZI
MQFTTIAALMSLAATGLAAPTASTGEGIASIGLRDAEMSMAAERSEEAAVKPETTDAIDDDDDDSTDNDDELLSFNATSAADTTTIEKRKFKGGWCGLHIKDVYGDYHQADVTVFDAEGNTIRTRHKKTDKSKKLNFKFDKGLPGKASLHVQVGGVGGDIARIQYKDQDFKTGVANTQNANCKVGKADQPWIYKSRFVTNLDCGFSC